MEYYSAIRKEDILPPGMTWMGPEHVIVNEIGETEEDKYCRVSLTYGI